jgi:hypothetical protein
MKNRAVLVLILVSVFSLSQIALSQQKPAHKYVGTKMCSACHRGEKKGNVFEIWLKSKHAQAYKVLETPEAAKVAKEKALKKPASQSPECLKCHVPTHNADKALLMTTFDPKDGVQCETCHGPGSDYKSIPVMKDRAKAVAAGLIFRETDKEIEEACKKCHNEESPTFKGFNFKEMWPKIKHAVPKQG